MRKGILFYGIITMLAVGCKTYKPVAKAVAYRGMYSEKPTSLLIMPPINRSTCVEAKEYFHSTLEVPLSEAGYYVIPPFLSMDILKRESAYDAELFLNQPVNKFGEVFGADAVLFTIIHSWDKSELISRVTVEVEYIIKSTKTNEILYTRKGKIKLNTGVNTGLGIVANMAASAINTAMTDYTFVARKCNSYTLADIPRGKYNAKFGNDSTTLAGKKEFTAHISK